MAILVVDHLELSSFQRFPYGGSPIPGWFKKMWDLDSMPGWWFGTCILFFHRLGIIISN